MLQFGAYSATALATFCLLVLGSCAITRFIDLHPDISRPFERTDAISPHALNAAHALQLPLPEPVIRRIANHVTFAPRVKTDELRALATYVAMLYYCEVDQLPHPSDWLSSSNVTGEDLTLRLTGYNVRAIDVLLKCTPHAASVVAPAVAQKLYAADSINGWSDGHKLVEHLLKCPDVNAATESIAPFLQMQNGNIVTASTVATAMKLLWRRDIDPLSDKLLQLVIQYNHLAAQQAFTYLLPDLFRHHDLPDSFNAANIKAWYEATAWSDGIKRTFLAAITNAALATNDEPAAAETQATDAVATCMANMTITEQLRQSEWTLVNAGLLKDLGFAEAPNRFLNKMLDNRNTTDLIEYINSINVVLRHPKFSIADYYMDAQSWVTVAGMLLETSDDLYTKLLILNELYIACQTQLDSLSCNFDTFIFAAKNYLKAWLPSQSKRMQALAVGYAGQYYYMLDKLYLPFGTGLPQWLLPLALQDAFTVDALFSFNETQLSAAAYLIFAVKHVYVEGLSTAIAGMQRDSINRDIATNLVTVVESCINDVPNRPALYKSRLQSCIQMLRRLQYVDCLLDGKDIDNRLAAEVPAESTSDSE